MACEPRSRYNISRLRRITTERMLDSSSLAVVGLVRSRRFATAQTTGTQWPPTLRAFVEGTPIITRKLPLVGSCVEIDFGTSTLNFGAPASLCRFMMSDVMALRSLSIVGSTCGVVYNATRRPRQINAQCDGVVHSSWALPRNDPLHNEANGITWPLYSLVRNLRRLHGRRLQAQPRLAVQLREWVWVIFV